MTSKQRNKRIEEMTVKSRDEGANEMAIQRGNKQTHEMAVKRTVERTSGELFFRESLPIYVNRVSESFQLAEHFHDFAEICYVAEGRGFHYIDNETLAVTAGDLFFIPIGTAHVFRPSSLRQDRSLVVYNCIFQTEQLQELTGYPLEQEITSALSGKLPGENRWLHVREQHGEFKYVMHRLLTEYETKQHGYRAQLLAFLLELVVLLQRLQQPTGEAKPSPDAADKVAAMKQYIHLHFQQPVTIEDVAAAANTGPRQGQRLFKHIVGKTILSYVQEQRIHRACELLSRPKTTVLEAAHHCGYEDLKHFTRLFKKQTGVTPRQYRLLKQR
ncbi:AraC family transcriptional regulator [Paenibacillus sp. J2TS4]|uniref:AraC family transcriptional regulator n=1 Tax=Paenibacillus sp. J2TS4 TaxID=2807194 RepID=UPI001B2307C9|nr:AraC family transcriptional regulator [Paenibacillus sp. J2TS4]GIP33319.1 hypothetical protein J2TS4_25290 [Paenibacillus sp. J2TS4]